MTRAKFNTKKTFQDSKPRAGGEDNKKLDDMVDTIKLPEKEYVAMRLLGPAIPYAQHWIEFHSTKKDKDVNIPKICLAFDPETEDFDSSKKCPYCDAGNKASVAYLTNAIIRDLQENEPAKKGKMTDSEKKTGFKEKSSKTWTPVKVVRITSTVASKFQNLSNANKVKDKKSGETVAKPLSDEKYGRDIQMLYDSKQAGAAKYDVQKGDERTPITEEESEYLLWNIEGLFEPEDLSRAKQEAAKFFGKGAKKGDDADYDEDDDMPKGKKGKKGKKDDYLDSDEEEAPKSKKKGKKPADSDEDDADEEDADSSDDADSDDDEPKSKKGKKGKPGLSAKDSDDDGFSDDDDDDDADDEDDEDEPKSKKGKKPAAKKGKKAADSDEDDADEDADSEEDEPKSKKKGKKKPADSDEDDEDEEEDEPKSKKGKGKEKPKAKGKKKPADSDDDDVDIDDLDEEEEDEEDEAPKSKKGKKDKKAKGKKSKKDADSDDDVPF